MMPLDDAQLDRAIGAVLGMAVADALGAGYEFNPPVLEPEPIVMRAGLFDIGEWTDDTAMAIPLLRAVAEGQRLDDEATLDGIVAAWYDWSRTAKDVGIQIASVLTAVGSAPTAANAREAAAALHHRTGRSGGNGSLMRTAPVALAYLVPDSTHELATAARAISELTHFDEDAGEACALWSLAIRHAILTGELDVRAGLAHIPIRRHGFWRNIFIKAAQIQPHEVGNNGWVIDALRSAWSAISHTSGFEAGVVKAVRCGHDTDTVAAIAGSLLGAVYGAQQIPSDWLGVLHGWGARDAAELQELVIAAVSQPR